MSKEIYLLVLESKKGNQKAQIKLYDLFCEAMFFICNRYIKNEDEAKDAMQDAFLKAFLNLNSYQDNTSFAAWLKRIVINTCIDHLKKNKIETVSIDNFSLEVVNEDNWNFSSEISKQEILKAIEQLKLKYQLVVKLYLLEGYDHEEISEILKIPVKTSRTQLRRGKLALRNLLKNEEYGT